MTGSVLSFSWQFFNAASRKCSYITTYVVELLTVIIGYIEASFRIHVHTQIRRLLLFAIDLSIFGLCSDTDRMKGGGALCTYPAHEIRKTGGKCGSHP